MKPPFTYFGGKTAIAPKIAALLPPHEHYVEPFAGSLAVLLAKRPSRLETVNDLDRELVTFWRMLRERPADLERACALTPHSRAEHAASFDPCDDELEMARRVWVRLTQGRAGHVTRRTGWRYYIDPHGTNYSMPDYLDSYISRIRPVLERLRDVSLECRPALDVISAYGAFADTLIYADPPYLGRVRTWGQSYSHEMRSDDDHCQLAETLHAARAAVILSGYHSPLYDDLYEDWHRIEIRAENGNGTDRKRTEVLWSNRPLTQQLALAMPP